MRDPSEIGAVRPGRQDRAIEFIRLSQVDEASLLRLLNDPRVLRHMPLGHEMGGAEVHAWVRAKEQHWNERGFGPWGILIGGTFAGWGGLQPFDDEVEVALVLTPEFWGWGRVIFERIRREAFDVLGLTNILAVLPPTRPRLGSLAQLGFTRVDTREIEGNLFIVYRASRPTSNG